MQSHKKAIVLVFLIVLAVTVTAVTVGRHVSKNDQQPFQHVTDTLPTITSKVKKLKVIRAAIERQGQPDAMAAIEILNDSDVAVTGFTLTSGEISIGEDGGIAVDVPVTVIEPHRTTTIRFPVSNLEKDVPVFIGGAIYADNTEDGQDAVLETMHAQRATEKAKRDARKGAAK